MRKVLGVLGALLLGVVAWAQTATSESEAKALETNAPELSAAQGPAKATASVPAGTPLKVKLETTISTFSSRVGDPFTGRISEPVMVGGKQMIPVGAVVEGRVTKLTEPRRINGRPTIGLFPEHVVMPDGQRYMLNAVLVDTNIKGTDVNQEGLFKGSGHSRRDQVEVAGGTGTGMLVGGLIGGGPGLLIGGAVGAGATATHWMAERHSAVLPAGTLLWLELSRPMTMSNSAAGTGQ